MRHEIAAGLLVGALLVTVGGLTWAATHPASPAAQRAAGWPVIGDLVWALRPAYVPPVADATAPLAGSWQRVGLLPTASATSAAPVTPTARPSRVTPPAVVGSPPAGPTELVLPASPGPPPRGFATVPAGPLPGRAPAAAALDHALGFLGSRRMEGRLGPYPLYTDLIDRPLLVSLEPVVSGLETSYASRYGLLPVPAPAESVVLFAQREDYDALKAANRDLAPLPASGHVAGGLVAVTADGRLREEVRATLIHELTHLLNRRALGPALPPWLDEGMADDLGQSTVGADGHLVPGTLGSTVLVRGANREIHGAWAALDNLRLALGGLPLAHLRELVDLDWRTFVADGQRERNYAESAYLVRFLLDAGDPALADGFRRFLAAVAAGSAGRAADLEPFLGVAWSPLAVRFRVWLASQEARAEQQATVIPVVAATAYPAGEVGAD
jgi:hypothetical protein